jgi:hypothetical protein
VILPLFRREGHEFIIGDGPVIIGHCIDYNLVLYLLAVNYESNLN